MKYRALLIDPQANRETKPEQSISNSLKDLEQWAAKVLAGRASEVSVVIYESYERVVREFRPDLTGVVTVPEGIR